MHRVTILYSWFVRIFTKLLPDIPLFMRFRGFLYSLGMESCGKNFQVCSSVYMSPLSGLNIGNNVYLAHNVTLIGLKIKIGNETIVGPNTVIVSTTHILESGSYRFGKSLNNEVIVSSSCWIGANCSVLPESYLPEGCILGAGSVLNKEFSEKNSLYAGIPAKFIKNIIH